LWPGGWWQTNDRTAFRGEAAWYNDKVAFTFDRITVAWHRASNSMIAGYEPVGHHHVLFPITS